MAEVTAALVKELREITGAGMMDCKKALQETAGDIDKAIEFLREKGLAGAVKKAGRIAAEGIVETLVCECGHDAVIVEVNAETDFVAKNETFKSYVAEVAKQALESKAADMEAFLDEKWLLDESLTVKEKLSSMISIIGENMNIRRFEKIHEENGLVVSYIHAGGKIGVLIDIETDKKSDAITEMGKNIAMQVAALRPLYTSSDEVDADYIAKEKEIRLLDQTYVRAEDGKQSVAQYVEEVAKANSANIKIKRFIRFETGEGLEKKSEDFAAEVAKQMGM